MDDLPGRDLTVVPLSTPKIPYGVFEIAKVDPYIASEIPETENPAWPSPHMQIITAETQVCPPRLILQKIFVIM